jgi:hypothetical protein
MVVLTLRISDKFRLNYVYPIYWARLFLETHILCRSDVADFVKTWKKVCSARAGNRFGLIIRPTILNLETFRFLMLGLLVHTKYVYLAKGCMSCSAG